MMRSCGWAGAEPRTKLVSPTALNVIHVSALSKITNSPKLTDWSTVTTDPLMHGNPGDIVSRGWLISPDLVGF